MADKTYTYSNTPVDGYNEFLREHFHTKMIEEEFAMLNWFMQKCKVTKDWLQGPARVQFKKSKASTITKGGLAAENEINGTTYLEGTILEPAKWSGALRFKRQDIIMHGQVNEENLFNLLPDSIKDLTEVMEQAFSLALFGDGSLTKTIDVGDATGIKVKNTDRIGIGFKVELDDGTDQVQGYISKIDKNTGKIELRPNLDLTGAVVDCTDIDAKAGVYMTENSGTNEFFSLVDHLLPATGGLGGSDELFGLQKSDYPCLQSILIDGSDIYDDTVGADNSLAGKKLLKKIFGAMAKAKRLKAKVNTLLCSYNTYAHICNSLQDETGAFKNVGTAMDYAGYSSISVTWMGQKLEIVGLADCDDDKVMAINTAHLEFKSSPKSYFEVVESPDGLKYYVDRNVDDGDYYYITDIMLQGQFVYTHVFDSFVIHSIDLPLLEV